MSDTLVLNKDGSPLSLLPISTTNWQDAISNVITKDVYVLKEYDDWVVRSPSTTFKVPSVVIVKNFVNYNRIVKYSRQHIFLRDAYTCKLCNKIPHPGELTLDHVIPRSKGGKTTWSNIVTSCKRCNEHKGNNENIRPNRAPLRPSYYQLIAQRQKYPISINDREWQDYLGWPEHLVTVTNRRK